MLKYLMQQYAYKYFTAIITTYLPHQDGAEIVSAHLDAMTHQDQEEFLEISQQTMTQPEPLTPQYSMLRKNRMQQPENYISYNSLSTK